MEVSCSGFNSSSASEMDVSVKLLCCRMEVYVPKMERMGLLCWFQIESGSPWGERIEAKGVSEGLPFTVSEGFRYHGLGP